jgi:hypothetical protein
MADEVVVFFGKRKVHSPADTTVGALLIAAEYTPPSDYALELRRGEGGPIEQTYTDPNQKLGLKNGEHFTAKFTGPIQPSDLNVR